MKPSFADGLLLLTITAREQLVYIAANKREERNASDFFLKRKGLETINRELPLKKSTSLRPLSHEHISNEKNETV